LKETIEQSAVRCASDVVELPIGRAVRIAEEEVFFFPPSRQRYTNVSAAEFRGLQIGENVRDWSASLDVNAWYPYGFDVGASPMLANLWKWRTTLAKRKTFQGVMADAGLAWFEYMQHTASAYRTPSPSPSPLSPPTTTSSSTAAARSSTAARRSSNCRRGGRGRPPRAARPAQFVGRVLLDEAGLSQQGSTVDTKGARQTTDAFENFYEFTGTKLADFPLVDAPLTELARTLDQLARELAACSPAALLGKADSPRRHEEHERRSINRRFVSFVPSWCKHFFRCAPVSGRGKAPGRLAPSPDDRAAGGAGLAVLPAVRPY